MKIREENILISKKIGISPEAITYIKPRLLSDSYKGDTASLLERVKTHRDGNNQSIEALKVSIRKREKALLDYPHNAEFHQKKLDNYKQVLLWTESKLPLYGEVIKFLENADKQQLNILLS